jgi:acyl-coenzyme A thioesterase PaaI-like protein
MAASGRAGTDESTPRPAGDIDTGRPAVELRAVPSPAQRLATLWHRLHPLPGGRWLFSRLFGWFVPYSGSIRATIEHLEPGVCRATLRDRRAVRQHLGSVHAVALVNLGEMTSGLAMTLALPPGVRGIVTTLEAEYHRKARGTLTAEAHVAIPDLARPPVDHRVETLIRDAAGQLVCRVGTVWRLDRA